MIPSNHVIFTMEKCTARTKCQVNAVSLTFGLRSALEIVEEKEYWSRRQKKSRKIPILIGPKGAEVSLSAIERSTICGFFLYVPTPYRPTITEESLNNMQVMLCQSAPA